MLANNTCTLLCSCFISLALVQNNTLEERVSLLEIQVDEIEEDITITRIDLTELETDVNFLFDEKVIQDERLFSLEQTTIGITGKLGLVEDELEGDIFLMKASYTRRSC